MLFSYTRLWLSGVAYIEPEPCGQHTLCVWRRGGRWTPAMSRACYKRVWESVVEGEGGGVGHGGDQHTYMRAPSRGSTLIKPFVLLQLTLPPEHSTLGSSLSFTLQFNFPVRTCRNYSSYKNRTLDVSLEIEVCGYTRFGFKVAMSNTISSVCTG